MARLATLGIALVLVGAACASGDEDGASTGPDTTRAPEATGLADPAPSTAPPADVTIVSLNILHGAFCPEATDRCGAQDRVDLFFSQLDRACPDLVALQEIDRPMLEKIRASAPGVCDGSYEVVWHGTGGVDRELVLARVPVLGQELTMLPGGLRSAFWVRARTDLGVVDLVVTHLASIDNVDCDAGQCPPPCEPPEPMRVCQARRVLEFLEAQRADDSLAVVAGDLNDLPDSTAVTVFTDGGLLDSHVAAGNAACSRDSREHCTAGREDEDLSELTDPEPHQNQRIDFVLAEPPPDCDPLWDPAGDDDGDGVPTGVFFPDAAEPTGPSGVVFPSDHSAVGLDLACG